jgi:thiol:disulfide interchange protein
MERGRWSLIAGALAVVLVGACAKTTPKHEEVGIAWKTTFDTALADAGTNGRPILLDFYTDW